MIKNMLENKYKKLILPKGSSWNRDIKVSIYRKFVWFLSDNIKNDKIKDFIFDFIIIKIDNFITGLENFKQWYKLIWKDRNWDYSFIYDMLEHKLFLTRKYLVENNRHENVATDNFYLTVAINLIDKVKNSKYEEEHFEYFQYSPFKFEPTGEEIFNPFTNKTEETFRLDTTVEKENYDDFLKKYPNSLKKVKKEKPNEEDKHTLCMLVSIHNQEKAKKLLFKILSERIEQWWD